MFSFILILVICCILCKSKKNEKSIHLTLKKNKILIIILHCLIAQLSAVVNPSSNISTINTNRQFQNRPEISTINENSKYNDYNAPPPNYEEMQIKEMPATIEIKNDFESDVPLPVIPDTHNRIGIILVNLISLLICFLILSFIERDLESKILPKF